MQQDFFELEFFKSLFLNQTIWKRTLERSLFSRKPLEIESLADAQFVR